MNGSFNEILSICKKVKKKLLVIAYLPACSISSEVSKSCREPIVNLMQSQLLIWGFLNGLENNLFLFKALFVVMCDLTIS